VAARSEWARVTGYRGHTVWLTQKFGFNCRRIARPAQIGRDFESGASVISEPTFRLLISGCEPGISTRFPLLRWETGRALLAARVRRNLRECVFTSAPAMAREIGSLNRLPAANNKWFGFFSTLSGSYSGQ
jgi:hypothetical protein